MERDFEWGYREANQGDVGSQVEVKDGGVAWLNRELVAILPVDMGSRFVCRSKGDPKAPGYWSYSRVRYRLPYEGRQSNCGIRSGDFVKVLRVPESREDGWGTLAVSSMSASVGKVFGVEKMHDTSGLLLKDGHWYPYFVLERVEKPVLEESKPKVRTVSDLADGEVICTNEGRWFQVVTKGEACDYGNDPWNRPEEDCGWVNWGGCHKGCRPARLLHAPTMESPAYGKEVFHVGEPSERFDMYLVFSDGKAQRAVVRRGEDYRVFRLSDLRVIYE